jgi:hypothetical protein
VVAHGEELQINPKSNKKKRENGERVRDRSRLLLLPGGGSRRPEKQKTAEDRREGQRVREMDAELREWVKIEGNRGYWR